jgi:hypothetical protein
MRKREGMMVQVQLLEKGHAAALAVGGEAHRSGERTRGLAPA